MGYCEEGTSPDCYGGFARIKFAADFEKQEAAKRGRHTIFLNAGDTYEGTEYFTFYRWKIVSEMMSMLDFDVIVSTVLYVLYFSFKVNAILHWFNIIDQSELQYYI